MLKIGILGAGITGLTLARKLRDFFDVEILEMKNLVGGIARPKNVNGFPYHVIGGHCMNSNNSEIMDFIFSVLPKSEWHLVNRDAKIDIKGNRINYPIEFSIKEIFNFDKDLAFDIVRDIFRYDEIKKSNLEEWFIGKFGKTLAEEYFIPYNEKIWKRDLKKMSTHWMEGKLPCPSKKELFEAIIFDKKDCMPHREFYYPNSNSMSTFIEELAKGTNILLDYNINNLNFKKGKWFVNDEKFYDIIISTIPLKFVTKIIKNTPKEIINESEKLKFNTVSNMLFESKPYEGGWIYFPRKDTPAYKQSQLGGFLIPKENFSTIEFIGKYSKEEILEESKKFPDLIKAVDYHSEDYPAYVVHDENYNASLKNIMEYINSLENFYTVGRFGEWTYYNMDKCMESAINLSEKIKHKYLNNYS